MTVKWNKRDKIKAWAVHAFTATGMVVGFKALELAWLSKPYEAIYWLILAAIIDGVDGAFARRYKVKQVLPNVDGHLIDVAVDFVNYAVTPAVIFYQMKMVPDFLLFPSVCLIFYSALYHNGNKKSVTEDFRFQGFPAWWNLVVYYFLILELPLWWNFVLVVLFTVLHFMPVTFIYVSRMKANHLITYAILVVMAATHGLILIDFTTIPLWLKIASVVPVVILSVLGLTPREIFPYLALKQNKTK